MLKKENRLKSNRAFCATYSNNKVVSNSSISLHIGYNRKDDSRPVRVGFVVSKKIHKRAVIRNRIKRLMRENVRLLLKNNEFPQDFQSLIFIAKNGMLNADFKKTDIMIKNILSKLSNK